jgi:hypothetical protein
LWGYDAQRASEPFRDYSNINLAYPYAEQPLIMEQEMSLRARSLASAVLLRPRAFDPAQEFAGIRVNATERGEFEIELPNAERAFVSLANELPAQIRVGETEIIGNAIRYARVKGNVVTGIGI